MMDVYGKFFLDFMKPFFGGIIDLFKYLFINLFQIFNVFNYYEVIKKYGKDMTGFGGVIVIVSILCLLALFGIIIFLLVKGIKKYRRYLKNRSKQESLVEEVENLNMDVLRLRQENQKFLSMADPENSGIEFDEDGNVIKLKEGESRFYKLTKVDEEMENYTAPTYANNVTLEEFCTQFRNYAASELGLYYTIDMIRLFVSAFASNRLIILQGISGTGKTSLAYAMGSFINNDSVIASVQPSWRDSTEFLGYFNEFTKRFNETEVLKKMYEATYKKDIYVTVLDEMNIARVEYYFAEMLSILELPEHDEWIVNLVSNGWDNDPKKVIEGRFQLPENMWYIGTINNDDSTFMVTDKVYDRAMPIEINEKCDAFEAPHTEKASIDYMYFEKLFKDAQAKYHISSEAMQKLNKMDEYNIEHFRISFGNRIVRQINDFVPVFVACGGNEMQALDYIIAHKILRKFDQLNSNLIKNELDDYIKFMEDLFGKDDIKECLYFLDRYKKSI